ncbi:short-chain dehydrogenase reductase SDR family [Fusarium pseudocircinatum]|uniref:Short-chain dehydrogenase reductase SDR family n=1 Tax=Fusarium pseudocircinatum TaxID=56676 RepID=A0A8H5PKR0_9HYPO|nr:short-chain dehydrogenase reductase SDR family [Fusarium pseudocircinatum]
MKGRKIVISGAGRGLGRALAIVTASQGATPVLLGRSLSALQEVSETIKIDSGATAYPIICDLSDPTSVAKATKEISESHPDIDILVNNGAHFTEGSLDKQTDDQILSVVNSAYARLTGASLPFRAAKAAQDGFTQGLVEELKGTSVRVTSVYPGLIEDVSPSSAEWQKERGSDGGITNKNVVDTIIYALSAPPNVSLRSIVIERTFSDFLI